MTRFHVRLALAFCMATAPLAIAQEDSRAPQGDDALGASASEFLAQDGETLYLTACAGCHQPQGQGAIGAGSYPRLAGNPRLEGGRYPAWIVIHGISGMPALGDYMDDAQVVAVVSYIQQNFGNRYEATLTEQDVADLREEAAP